MSLNQIQLTNQQLTNWYANVLIESTTASPVPTQQTVKFLGKNTKHIVLLVSNDTAPFLPDDELSFLTNILSACKLSLADVAIVNLHSIDKEEVEALIEPLAPKHVLLFGITPLSIDLPINFPQFQLQAFNKRIYLYSPDLKTLENNKELKLKLWNNLKTLFGL
ncbi:MAG: hypothetical protein ACTHMD_06220 [Flavisolibacter sp.]